MSEIVWSGREPLTDSLERDYADMNGDGWDLIWIPTSPLTTPWESLAASHAKNALDPDKHVPEKIDIPPNAALRREEAHQLRNQFAVDDMNAVKELNMVSRRGPARKAVRILRDWMPDMEQHGSKLTSGGHWRVSQRAMRPRKK